MEQSSEKGWWCGVASNWGYRMGDLTRNLSRWEFACKCGCGLIACDHELVGKIQAAVDYFSAIKEQRLTVHITGGNRCFERNMHTPGASRNSRHMDCIAADHYIAFVSPQELYDYYDRRYPKKHGLGLYPNRVHLDVRSEKARWTRL